MMDPSSSSSPAPAAASSAGGDLPGGGGGVPFVSEWITGISQRYQHMLDKSTPHVLRRWLGFAVLALVYVVRVAIIQGFYVVSYALGIYVLSLFIAFLSPQVDPGIQGLVDGSGPTLPTRSSDEFRPFVRRLPEFKFWYSITKAFFIAFVLTFFSAFDVPVFWPILVFYFFVLFVATMKRQIQHMIKYKYLPLSTGKQSYGKKPVSLQDVSLSRP